MSVFEIVIYAIATVFSVFIGYITLTIYLLDRFGILNDDMTIMIKKINI